MTLTKIVYNTSQAAIAFVRAFREIGFAVLTDHPIDRALIQTVYGEWQGFFASPDKHRYTFDPTLQSGYFPFQQERGKDSQVADLKEFFHLYPFATLPKGIGDTTWQLFRALEALAAELLGWLERSVPPGALPPTAPSLQEAIANSQATLLRVLHYPPLAASPQASGAVRAAAHEDVNLLTLLPAATETGLEVRDRQGQWHPIPSAPGDIVVNVGDMLQLASDGYFRSTTHRVVNPTGLAARRSRYALPLFLHPHPDVPLCPGVTAREFLQQRLQEIGLLSV